MSLSALSLVAQGCRETAPPDFSPFLAYLREDAQVIALLQEADTLREREAATAEHNLRELALPRARANWEALGAVSFTHQELRSTQQELQVLLGRRVDAIVQYAEAIHSGELIKLLESVRTQRKVEHDIGEFQQRLMVRVPQRSRR